MGDLLCNLFAIPLGAALLALIAWPFMRKWFNRKVYQFDSIDILWLADESKKRLKHCAQPDKLRRMEPSTIEKFLDREPFANLATRPTRLQIETWPLQARLICDGKFEELRAWQAEWIGSPEYQSTHIDLEGLSLDQTAPHFPSKADFYWLALLSILLVASAALYAARPNFGCSSKICKACADDTTKPPNIPPVVTTGGVSDDESGDRSVNLISDHFFEYNSTQLLKPQANRAQNILSTYFSEFDDVKITGIEGFTDPIGTLCSNAKIAQGRATAVKTLLEKTGNVSIDPSLKPKGLGPSRDDDDVQIWEFCRNNESNPTNPYVGKPAFEASKVDCPADPELQALYPDANLTPADPYRLRSVSEAVRMSEAQQKLKSCVSPMRRVTIRFSGKPKRKSAPQAGPADEEKTNAAAN